MSTLENKENREPMEPTKNLDNERMKEEIHKHKCEIENLMKEADCKDQCLRTYSQENEEFKNFVYKYNKNIKALERKIQQQTVELSLQYEFWQARVEQHSKCQNELSQDIQKFESMKNTIKDYQTQQRELEEKKQRLETKFNEQNAKLGPLQDNYNGQIQNIQDQTKQEIEDCKKEIAEIESIYKRLQIRTSSLETALSQKLKECQDLSTFYDDMSKK